MSADALVSLLKLMWLEFVIYVVTTYALHFRFYIVNRFILNFKPLKIDRIHVLNLVFRFSIKMFSNSPLNFKLPKTKTNAPCARALVSARPNVMKSNLEVHIDVAW